MSLTCGMVASRWIPLLIMTGLSSEEELLAGFAAGADDYLVKPISVAVLQARINAMQRISSIQAASTASR